MKGTEPTALERELIEALARRDTKAAECPIDRVSNPPEICPRCGATAKQTCFVKNDADHRFVYDIRTLATASKRNPT